MFDHLEDHKELVPGAAIRWKTNHGRLRTYFLRSINHCSTSKAAHATALKEAKAWIHAKLKGWGSRPTGKRGNGTVVGSSNKDKAVPAQPCARAPDLLARRLFAFLQSPYDKEPA